MGSNIMRNSCWVIKVIYLDKRDINFNEAYWTFDKCKAAILKKIELDDLNVIDDFTFMDMNSDIIYEAKHVDIFE